MLDKEYIHFLYTKYKDIVDKALDVIRNPFKNVMKIENRESARTFACVTFGERCDKCGKALGVCDQYLCVMCSPLKYYCTECLKPRDNIRSKTDLVHPHAFYFLQKDSTPVLDELRIKYVSISDTEEYNEAYVVYCKSCKEDKTLKVIWKCANCEQVDLCPDCFHISRNPDHSKYKTLHDICARFKHDVKTHIYVRVDLISQLGFHY